MQVFIKEELKLDFPEFDKREFGFVYSGSFRRKHSFKDKDGLISFLNMLRPSECFVSNARYISPKELGGYLGCDLFFDLDRSDGNVHLLYPDIDILVECLEQDFGFKHIIINKSGFKGYHVVVFDEVVQDLKANERDEILQYIEEKYKIKSIDRQCTCDVHRVRRLEGSFNPKSGRVCKRLVTKGGL